MFISRPDHMQITPDTEGITLSQHTVPTWLLVISVRGTHINDMNTSTVLKQQKDATHNSQQNTAKWEQWLVESHTAQGWQQTDQVRVRTVATLLSSPSSSSTVQSSRRRKRRRRSVVRPKNWGFFFFFFFGLKCLRLKRTQDSLWDWEQQLWGFPAQREHECVRFALQTELAFIYINHSSSFSTRTWVRHGKCKYNSWHLQFKDAYYTVYTHEQQSLVHDCESTVCCTHSKRKCMAKKVKLHLRAHWAIPPNIPFVVP